MDGMSGRRALLIGGFGALTASAATLGHPGRAEAADDDLVVRGDDVDGTTAAFGTRYAQREAVLDLRDLYRDEDGTTTFPGTTTRVRDHTAAMQRALRIASAAGSLATIAVPPGSFVMDPFTIDRPIRILGLGAPTCRYGQPDPVADRIWGGAQLVRSTRSPGVAFITVDSNGVAVEGISFDGRGSTAVGVHVVNGFELRMLHARVINFHATALLIDHANNAVFDTVHVNNAGSAAGQSSVVINSTPLDMAGMPTGIRTNTLDFRSLTIEQSRATALEIGVDPEKNRIDLEQHPEYLRFTDLHIESTSYSESDPEFLPDEPAIRIGAVYSASFIAPFVYGGSAPVLRQDASEQPSSRSTGVTVIGGTLRGLPASVAATPTLVDLRKGDEFRLLGTRFTQYSGSPVSIGRDFGPRVMLDPTSQLVSAAEAPAGTPTVDDRRPDGARSPTVVLGTLAAADTVELRRGIDGRSRPVRIEPAGAHVATITADRSCDEVRGRIVFTTGPNPAAGLQVRISLPRQTPYRPSASAQVTPSDAAAARLLPYAQLWPGQDENELHFCMSHTPAPNSSYGFYYAIIG